MIIMIRLLTIITLIIMILTLLYSLDSQIVGEINELAVIQCRLHSLRSCGFTIKFLIMITMIIIVLYDNTGGRLCA